MNKKYKTLRPQLLIFVFSRLQAEKSLTNLKTTYLSCQFLVKIQLYNFPWKALTYRVGRTGSKLFYSHCQCIVTFISFHRVYMKLFPCISEGVARLHGPGEETVISCSGISEIFRPPRIFIRARLFAVDYEHGNWSFAPCCWYRCPRSP